jgi:hypothetical protein
MLTFFYGLFGVAAFVLAVVCLRGGVRLTLAVRAGEKVRAKALAWAVLRIGLLTASCACIAASHGRDIADVRVALILLIIAGATRFPADARVLGWIK